MSTELDYDLTIDQWETLKALRLPATERRVFNRFVLDQLIALDLATITEGIPWITSIGRKVLIRGSSKLLDLVA